MGRWVDGWIGRWVNGRSVDGQLGKYTKMN